MDLDASNAISDFNANNATPDSFKVKEKTAGKKDNKGRIDAEVMLTLKQLSNF